MIKRLIYITLYISLSKALSAQCPDRAFLFHQIVWLRDSSKVSTGDQLRELSSYLKKVNACPYQNDSTHAMLIARIGWLYSQQKDFFHAIDFTNQAVNMIHRHLTNPNINESHLIKYYNNLRIFYDSTSEEKHMIEAIDSCIGVAIRLWTGFYYAMNALTWQVEYLFEKGDYYKSMNLASLAENICRKTGYFTESKPFFTIYQINSLIGLRKYENANQLADTAIQESLISGDAIFIGTLFNVKTDIAASTGKTKEAIRCMKLALYYNKKSGYHSGYATSWNNLGYKLYFRKLHQNDKALAACLEALKYVDNDEVIDILNNIANIYVSQGDFEKAFDYFHQAFDKIQPGTDEGNLLQVWDDKKPANITTEYVINLLLDKAYAFFIRYKQNYDDHDLKHALRIYKTADRFMDKMKNDQTEISSKLFWRLASRRLYEQAIESCFLLANTEEAFYFFEKSRAVLLYDQLRQEKIGEKEIGEMAVLKRTILRTEKTMSGLDPASGQYAELQRNLFFNKQELNRLDQLARVRNPWYYQSLIDTSFVSLAAIQNGMTTLGTETILEFFQGDSGVYLLTIHSNKTRITRIDKNQYEKIVDRFSAYLKSVDLQNRDFNGFMQCSQDLFHLIFPTEAPPPGKTIISPDGVYFPFEALVVHQSLPDPEYFLNDHEVSYAYSIRYLLNDFKSNSTVPAGSFLGLAPVHYPDSLRLSPLIRSNISLEKISFSFPHSRTLLGSHASRNNFMKLFDGYRIIQLYTHAADSSSSGEPVIYFCDSALYLSELIPEKKPATRLIVLSACETGNGRLYQGEGVFSFNRGFAALGIPGSIINLWAVDNESTYRITELFYKYVSEGLPTDMALQKAKLDFIKSSSGDRRLPYYWAAPVFVGKTETLVVSGHSNLFIDLMISGVMIAAFLIFFLWAKSKTRNP
jgi:CHAT domain-containing protein/tetratricopeptide (TPR) repeat protein